MKGAPPAPVSKAFLVCREIVKDPDGEVTALVGLARGFTHHAYPVAKEVCFFARLTSAHGAYYIEVQLQKREGEVVWRDGPPDAWNMADPLQMYDLNIRLNVPFPEPGSYDLVLLANDEEIARQPFVAQMAARARR